MKLYSYYTATHQVLLDDWFRPSLIEDLDTILEKHEQECPTGAYMREGWTDTMKRKVDLIIRAIEENPNQVFIYADVDLQFFKPVRAEIEKLISDNDMVIQKNSPLGEVCAGFFAAVGNKKNLMLWQDIRRELDGQTKWDDQDILNKKLLGEFTRPSHRAASMGNQPYQVLSPNFYGLKWDYLPDRFLCGGTYKMKIWKPGQDFFVPKELVLHHANWTIGIENKIAQLKYVRDLVLTRE